MQYLHDAAVPAAENLREGQGDGPDEEATDRRPCPARHRERAKQRFGRGHPFHDYDAEPRRGQAQNKKCRVVGRRDADFVPDDEDRGRADQAADHQRPG